MKNKGDKKEMLLEDYHSHNTEQLKVKQVEKLLLSLPEVQAELKSHVPRKVLKKRK